MKIYEAALTAALEETLIRLSAEWEAENSCRGYRTNTPEDLAGRRVFLAEEDGAIIGYLFGLREKAKETSSVMTADTPYFLLEEIYVLPARRSQGIGGALFRFVEDRLRAEGFPFVLLSTSTKNVRAILHFYLDELDMSFWNATMFKKL